MQPPTDNFQAKAQLRYTYAFHQQPIAASALKTHQGLSREVPSPLLALPEIRNYQVQINDIAFLRHAPKTGYGARQPVGAAADLKHTLSLNGRGAVEQLEAARKPFPR